MVFYNFTIFLEYYTITLGYGKYKQTVFFIPDIL